MSSIRTSAAAVRGMLPLGRSSAFPAVTPRRQSPSPDQTLMYAWSIGTTRAAHPGERPSEKSADGQNEQCPPPPRGLHWLSVRAVVAAAKADGGFRDFSAASN